MTVSRVVKRRSFNSRCPVLKAATLVNSPFKRRAIPAFHCDRHGFIEFIYHLSLILMLRPIATMYLGHLEVKFRVSGRTFPIQNRMQLSQIQQMRIMTRIKSVEYNLQYQQEKISFVVNSIDIALFMSTSII